MVTSEAPRLTLHTLDITDSDRYRDYGYPWAEWDLLRREAPIYWYQRPGFEPFWAITRHADIRYISAHPELFSNSQMLRLNTAQKLTQQQTEREFQTNRHGGDPSDPQDFIWMDPPEHRQHRGIVARHFTPRVMKTLEDHFGELAENYVSDFADKVVASFADKGADSAVDVVHELSAKLPVAAICDMGGVPEEDWEKIFEWTEAFAGQDDPEYWEPGENSFQATQRVVGQWFRHTQGLIEERHRNGFGDDLLSDLLQAEIDGRKLTPDEVHNYFFLLLGAGNETTRNAITGGVKALLDHPEQMQMLVEDESLVPSAVRGDPALDIDRDPVPANRGAGCRAARPDDPQGRVGGALVPVGQPRRGDLRGSLQVRHHAQGERPFCLWGIRRALLPRRQPRALGDALDLPRVASDPAATGDRG